MNARLLVVVVALGAACAGEKIEPPPLSGDALPSAGFADALIAVTAAGATDPTSCTDTLPACADGGLSTGTCPANPALGPNDGVGHTIPANGVLEVAFRCGQILEHVSTDGTATMDFTVWATFPPDGEAQVELSYDGSVYFSGYPLAADPSDPGKNEWPIDLARTDEFVEFARFVRIVDQGAGGIVVDAVESL